MNEYVRLEDVLNICSAYCPDDDGSCSKAGTDLREMLDELEALNTVSIEQKRGYWIELPKAWNSAETPCQCSECKHILSFYYTVRKSNFCPNCGVPMDVEG